MHLMHFTRACHTVQVNLIGGSGLLALMNMHVPVEECGETRVGKHAGREVKHALRTQVGQAVLCLVVVEQLPSWVAFSISPLNVHPVSVHVDWKHCFLIEIDHHKGWVLPSVSSDRAADISEHDGHTWVGHALNHLVVGLVRVAMHCEPDNILEALHQGTIPSTKLMLALLRRVVRNQECKSFLRLDFQQFLFEPCEHMSRVFPLSPCVPVETVASLSVICNDTRACRHGLLVEEFDWHAVIAILAKLFVSLLSQPVLPHILEVVNFVVDTGGCE